MCDTDVRMRLSLRVTVYKRRGQQLGGRSEGGLSTRVRRVCEHREHREHREHSPQYPWDQPPHPIQETDTSLSRYLSRTGLRRRQLFKRVFNYFKF